jgi:GTPase SAR1 family protein
MNAIILHLSDIHIRDADDPVLDRARRIADAVRGIGEEPDFCIMVLSGDIAFSGLEEQYQLALDFIGSIRSALAVDLGKDCQVKCVVVPGNHDCDYSRSAGARQVFVEAFARRDRPPVDKDIYEICTAVQASFFELRDAVEEQALESTPDHDRLYYRYRFVAKSGEAIVFDCYNTAWLCQLHGGRGSLYFPLEVVGAADRNANAAIAVFHHPYGWLPEQNDREFRTHVERSADVILTGHEHVHTRRKQEVSTGERNEYIEGAALQETGEPQSSAFNVIVLDTRAQRQRVLNFRWNGEIYAPSDLSSEWDDLQVNRLRSRRRFEPPEQLRRQLEDPGVSLRHPERGELELSDVFVFPDFREVVYRRRETPPIISGDNFLSQLIGLENVLITGADKAGKTSLAKRLVVELHEKGYVPLLLEGSRFRGKSSERLHDRLVDAFIEQYGSEASEEYRQLDNSRRVVIVDNYHKLRLRSADEDSFLGALERFAAKLIFIANDIAQHMSEIVDARRILDSRDNYRHLRILPFGHLRRSTLVEKWFLLSPTLREDEELLAQRIRDVERKLDTICGKNFVPAYPVFVLSVLQAQESSTPVDTSASTYGYFFELFIRNALAVGSDKTQFDIKTGVNRPGIAGGSKL